MEPALAALHCPGSGKDPSPDRIAGAGEGSVGASPSKEGFSEEATPAARPASTGGFPGALTCVLALHAGVTEESGGRGCHCLPSASATVWPPQGAGVCTPQTPRASPGQGVSLSPWKWAVTLLPLPPWDTQGGLGFLGRHRALWSVHCWTLGILCSGKFHGYI